MSWSSSLLFRGERLLLRVRGKSKHESNSSNVKPRLIPPPVLEVKTLGRINLGLVPHQKVSKGKRP